MRTLGLHSISVFLFFVLVFLDFTNAQSSVSKIRLGVTYGTGSKMKVNDYTHNVTFYKTKLNYRFKDKENWAFEFSLEPSFNIAKHQLLNRFFVQPSAGENYKDLRDLYTQERTLKEYVLNFGLIARYKIIKGISVYAIGSIGPMIGDIGTERLAKGFAFSDILGIGLAYQLPNRIMLDFRYSVRHTSNAELKQPNGGHNTTNTEFSILFNL